MTLNTLCRMGFGSMQLTGSGHWGAADDPEHSMQVLREAVDVGVTHIDTADAYGPFTAEKYIRKALHPYPDGLTIATKGGLTRQGPNQWAPCGRPEYLRQCVEMSLRRLQIERIELYYLHRIDPAVPLEDQLGVLADMQAQGKIRHGPPLVKACRAPSAETRRRTLVSCWTKGSTGSERVASGGRGPSSVAVSTRRR